MACARLVVLGFGALALGGCGATGLSWVGEGHAQASQHTVATSESSTAPAPVHTASVLVPEDAPRPRLSRTITLGENGLVGAGAGARAGGAPAAGSGVSVTVNNYNVVSAYSGGYGVGRGYGYFAPGYASPSYARPSSGVVGSSPQAGQNWPAISDHGPSFPLRAAPASPWSRTQ